jgi:hypothetical protein
MQKYFRIAFCFFSTFVFIFSAPAYGQNAKDVAIVLKTIGKVQVDRSGNGQPYRARKGSRLNSGNVVQTGTNSLASIVFTDDKSLLKVRSRSRITIRGKREQGRVKKTIFMRLGEIWAKVTKGSFYRVETPGGVAAVKGTLFYIKFKDGLMSTFVFEGLVEYIFGSQRMEIKPGEVGEMRQGEAPTVRKFSLDEIPADILIESLENLEVEFENDAGQKKKLNIKMNRQ